MGVDSNDLFEFHDARGREYRLRGSETRTLSTVCAFRVVPARRAVERLMLLDAVLADADLNWLTSDAEKVAYVAALTASQPAAELHAAAHDVSPRRPVKTFPGTFPIEVDPGGR